MLMIYFYGIAESSRKTVREVKQKETNKEYLKGSLGDTWSMILLGTLKMVVLASFVCQLDTS